MIRLAVLAAVFVVGIGSLPGQPGQTAWATPPHIARMQTELQQTATLHDVLFIDADQGWAVGDHGLILATRDGGRSWATRVSGTQASLRGIAFVDNLNGWIVGGEITPYSRRSRGVVLRTKDGGRNWTLEDVGPIPMLKGVVMKNEFDGFAYGDSNSLFVGGLLTTRDSGRSWETVPGGAGESWHCGVPLDNEGNDGRFLGGNDGRQALVRGNDWKRQSAGFPAPHLRASCLAGRALWIAGSNGLVRLSQDETRSWLDPTPEKLRQGLEEIDFRTVASHGDTVWLAGSPGSVVVRVTDSGKNWEVFATDQTVPIEAIHFVDEHRGWAVGALGRILSTKDGGKTWQVQKSGGDKAAVLVLASSRSSVPWEAVTMLAGEQAYITAVEVLTRDAGSPFADGEFNEAAFIHQAALLSGAASGEVSIGFVGANAPEQSAEILRSQWYQTHGELAEKRWQSRVEKLIRQWRPTVILTESELGVRETSRLEGLIGKAVLEASTTANNDRSETLPAWLELPKWRVERIFSLAQERAAIEILPQKLSPRLSDNLGDATAAARSLVQANWLDSPTHKFRRLMDHSDSNAKSSDFFAGYAIAGGSGSRRQAASAYASQSQTAAAAVKKNQLLTLAQRLTDSQSLAEKAHLDALLRDLDVNSRQLVLFQFAQQLTQQGEFKRAREIWLQAAEEAPHSELAEVAADLVWRYSTSAEVQLLEPKQPRPASTDEVASGTGVENANVESDSSSTGSNEFNGLVPVFGAKTPDQQPDIKRVSHWQTSRDKVSSLDLAELLKQYPLLAADPAVKLAEVQKLPTPERNTGLDALVRQTMSDAWKTTVMAERLVTREPERFPKPLYSIMKTEQRPKLDESLDEPLWQRAPLTLTSAVAGSAKAPKAADTQVWFAWDDEFFYLAARCEKDAAFTYAAPRQTRTYDADLTKSDRLVFHLDLDRDYLTSMELAIDWRGWTNDSTCGCSEWNPHWYVAPTETADHWQVEVAIPWQELGGCPATGHAWGGSVQRIIPSNNAGKHHVSSTGWPLSHSAQSSRLADWGMLMFRK